MELKAKLMDFLVHLPEVDNQDKRKGLITFAGFSHLGIYLDWEGSNVEFFHRLLEEFGRREKEALVQFLGQLPKWPGLSVERQEPLAALQQAVSSLGAQAWQEQFSVTVPAAVAERLPNSEMVAMSVVSTVLTPYFKLGHDQLVQQEGAGTARLAERVWQKVKQAFAGDAASKVLAELYQDMPEKLQADFVDLLSKKVAADPALARELAALLAGGDEEDREALGRLVNVAQDVGTVEGELVGLIYGLDSLPEGIRMDVKHKIGTVGRGASVVGAIFGAPGPVHVGGEQHYGDHVEGDQENVDTGGGAHVGGNVDTGGGDFTGRDRIVHGDEIRGDQVGGDNISVGDVSGQGIAIGRGASAGFDIRQGMPDDAVEQLFATFVTQLQQATSGATREEALQKVEGLKMQARRGAQADDDRMADLIGELAELAPSVVKTLVGLFSTTVLAEVAGAGTKYVIRRLQRREA